MARSKTEEIFVTLSDATVHAHEKGHEQFVIEKFRIQKKVIVLSYKDALTFHPGMYRVNGRDVMAVRVVCKIGEYATYE